MSNITPKYGWKKDEHDARDKVLRFKAVNLNALPKKVDLREHCSTVENQTTLGSCTANAAAGALEYLEIKDGVASDKFENFSRLFIYYNTREIQNTINVDSGGSLRDTMKAVSDCGACDELLWGYDVTKFAVKPPEECYTDAYNHRITEYSRLETLPDMLQCLADGFPFVFGFMVYPDFGGPEVAKTGILQLPKPDQPCQGGHAVCAVGYDMDAKTVLVRNSWGEGWGQGGYFTMPFDYISNPALAQDFWTIRRVEALQPLKQCVVVTAMFKFYKAIFGYKD
jgi:C1A family cysteine protease